MKGSQEKPTDLTPKKGKSKTSRAVTLLGQWHDAFIDELSTTLNVSAACSQAKVSRQTAYDHKSKDSKFAERWQTALDAAIESAEGELYRRAVDGDEVNHYDKDGKLTSTEYRRSDLLLIFLLKAHKPDKYREGVDAPGSVTVIINGSKWTPN